MKSPLLVSTLAFMTVALMPLALAACGDGSGGGSAGGGMGGSQAPGDAEVARYEETPEAVTSGERIFAAQACNRCHTDAGSALAPSLIDSEWLYGGEPENIYESIMNGRPRGMAPYTGRLSSREVWHLVAFIRSRAK